MVKVKLYTKEQ